MQQLNKGDRDPANSRATLLIISGATPSHPAPFSWCQALSLNESVTYVLQVIDSDEGSDDKAVTAMGILNTIETILTVMEDQKEIMTSLEAIVLTVVGAILQNNVMEFYEEVMSIIYSLTCTSISTHMWQV